VDDVLVLDVFGRAQVPEGTAEAEPEDLAPALEALCFALGREVTIAEAAATLDRTPAAVSRAAGILAMELRGRGLMLQHSESAIQLVTRPEMAWAVQRALHPERPSRLSRAAMETLAIIAYRQPATKAIIEAIRGVDCEAVLEHLSERRLIEEVARQDTPGHPRLFGTTLRFLQLVGLERIEDLPPVSESVVLPNLE
jgi:segregation and condensation protein B